MDISYDILNYVANGKSHLYGFHCTNLEDGFKCGEGEERVTGDVGGEINLDTVINEFSRYEISFILNELRKHYNIDESKEMTFMYGFEEFSTETLNITELNNTILYKDGEFIYSGVEEINSLLISINIRVTIGEEKEYLQLYIDFE